MYNNHKSQYFPQTSTTAFLGTYANADKFIWKDYYYFTYTHTHTQPAKTIFVGGVYMISRLSTMHWTTNK